MKCEKCPNAATSHITEIHSEDNVEEVHLCEMCANKYLAGPNQAPSAKPAPAGDLEEAGGTHRECEACGLKFVDFRNTGRLGCPHDYEVFGDELGQLLENIHGETRHTGKVPRRQPQARQARDELMGLRKQLAAAVQKEDYEDAARLRDRIRRLEEA